MVLHALPDHGEKLFLMMSYENHQHNYLIIIDMTDKFHTDILGKITINKILKKLTC